MCFLVTSLPSIKKSTSSDLFTFFFIRILWMTSRECVNWFFFVHTAYFCWILFNAKVVASLKCCILCIMWNFFLHHSFRWSSTISLLLIATSFALLRASKSKTQSHVYNYAIIVYELSLNYIHLTFLFKMFKHSQSYLCLSVCCVCLFFSSVFILLLCLSHSFFGFSISFKYTVSPYLLFVHTFVSFEIKFHLILRI